jgi:pterin-4a-carbinolamine dehydratase
MEQALDSAEVDNALDSLPDWRHSGEFLVRVVAVGEQDKGSVQQRVQRVETDPERCSFTDTETGMMIYLGDVGGEGISQQDLQTAAKIDSVLAGAI